MDYSEAIFMVGGFVQALLQHGYMGDLEEMKSMYCHCTATVLF